MTSKYVREMVLVPKQQQAGGGQQPAVPIHDSRQLPPLYWQRQALLSQWQSAPVVDEAIRLLQDIKSNIGQRTFWPGAGTSDYFRLQNQLQDALPPTTKGPPKEVPEPLPKPPKDADDEEGMKRQRPVGTWQPKHEPVYTRVEGDTEAVLKKKYPDTVYLVPPQNVTVQGITQAYNDAWKTVPFWEGIKYRVKPLLSDTANAVFQRMKSEAITVAKQLQQEKDAYDTHYSGENIPEEWKQKQQGKIDALRNQLDVQWRQLQNYIYQSRATIKESRRKPLKSPEQKGHTSLKDTEVTNIAALADDEKTLKDDFDKFVNDEIYTKFKMSRQPTHGQKEGAIRVGELKKDAYALLDKITTNKKEMQEIAMLPPNPRRPRKIFLDRQEQLMKENLQALQKIQEIKRTMIDIRKSLQQQQGAGQSYRKPRGWLQE